jgi:hypothetical protein
MQALQSVWITNGRHNFLGWGCDRGRNKATKDNLLRQVYQLFKTVNFTLGIQYAEQKRVADSRFRGNAINELSWVVASTQLNSKDIYGTQTQLNSSLLWLTLINLE